MSWFNEVAHGGTSEYERQSWRDSFNEGRAAGDMTGATNARLAAERNAFQGATWGGSSTQPNALERARQFGVAPTTGPGNPAAVNDVAAVKPRQPAGPGRFGPLLTFLDPSDGPLKPKMEEDVTSVMVSGRPIKPDQGWSDAAEVEQRYGEAEFMSPAWFYSWAVSGVDGVRNVNEMRDEFGSFLIRGVEDAVKAAGARERAITNEQFQQQAAQQLYELRNW